MRQVWRTKCEKANKNLWKKIKNVIFRIILRKWKYKNFNFTAIFLLGGGGGGGGRGGEGGGGGMGGEIKKIRVMERNKVLVILLKKRPSWKWLVAWLIFVEQLTY